MSLTARDRRWLEDTERKLLSEIEYDVAKDTRNEYSVAHQMLFDLKYYIAVKIAIRATSNLADLCWCRAIGAFVTDLDFMREYGSRPDIITDTSDVSRQFFDVIRAYDRLEECDPMCVLLSLFRLASDAGSVDVNERQDMLARFMQSTRRGSM